MMKRRESKAMVYRKVIMEANPDKLNASELPDTLFDEYVYLIYKRIYYISSLFF